MNAPSFPASRIVIASFASSAAAFVPSFVYAALYITSLMTGSKETTTLDDTPERAMMLLFGVSPVLYLLLTALSIASGFLLRKLGMLTPFSLLALMSFADFLASLFVTVRNPSGLIDQMVTFAVVFCLFFVNGLCWLSVWWIVCLRPSRKQR